MSFFMKGIVLLLLFSSIGFSQVIEDGDYFFISKHSGNCIDVESLSDKAKIVQAICQEVESQKFHLTHISDDHYSISNISIGDSSNTNGSHLYKSSTPDEFKIIKENNSYKIKSSTSGKYITSKPYSNKIIQYYGNKSQEQLWNITTNIDEKDVIPKEEFFNDFSLYNEGESIINGNCPSAVTKEMDFRNGLCEKVSKIDMKTSGIYYFEYTVVAGTAHPYHYVGLGFHHKSDIYLQNKTSKKIGWVIDFYKGEIRFYADDAPYIGLGSSTGQSFDGNTYSFDTSRDYLYLGIGNGASAGGTLIRFSDTITMKDLMTE